jgi:predicted GNAT family acetyltransferase
MTPEEQDTLVQSVRDDSGEHRYVLPLDGATAFIDYHRTGGVVSMLHAEVPQQYEGRGIGAAMVRGALLLARQAGEKVRPRCSFVVAYLRRHAEFNDLLS